MEFKYLAIGMMTLALLGSALSVGLNFSNLLQATARNPSTSDKLQRMAFVGAGLAEAMGLLAFVIVMILIFS